MLRTLTLILPFLLVIGESADAQSVQRVNARNGMTAIGTAQDFEVLSRAGASKNDYLCAAGTFADRRAGAAQNDWVIVTRALGPSAFVGSRRGVAFTVNGAAGDGGDGRSFLNSGQGIGTSTRVGTALHHCRTSRTRDSSR